MSPREADENGWHQSSFLFSAWFLSQGNIGCSTPTVIASDWISFKVHGALSGRYGKRSVSDFTGEFLDIVQFIYWFLTLKFRWGGYVEREVVVLPFAPILNSLTLCSTLGEAFVSPKGIFQATTEPPRNCKLLCVTLNIFLPGCQFSLICYS